MCPCATCTVAELSSSTRTHPCRYPNSPIKSRIQCTCIATNAALLVFAANVPALAGARPGTKLWVFVAVQYALFGLMTLVDILVPDTTFSYDVQIARGELFRKRVIEEQVGDDDDDDDDDEDEEAAHGAARVSDVADVRVHERDSGPYCADWERDMLPRCRSGAP